MEIITFESKAYKELDNKITAIADYIFNHLDENKTDEDEIWVDSYEVCTFLKISDRTLQRLRAAGMISYSDIKGHYFYKIKEVKRMLEERLIKRDKECINELITNHQKYVKERRNSKQEQITVCLFSNITYPVTGVLAGIFLILFIRIRKHPVISTSTAIAVCTR